MNQIMKQMPETIDANGRCTGFSGTRNATMNTTAHEKVDPDDFRNDALCRTD